IWARGVEERGHIVVKCVLSVNVKEGILYSTLGNCSKNVQIKSCSHSFKHSSRSRYCSRFSLASREKCCGMSTPILPMEGPGDSLNILNDLVTTTGGDDDIDLVSTLGDPDIVQLSPSGVGENVFLNRVSGKILENYVGRKIMWDIFATSPTGGSRYCSSVSLGSRGKCSGIFSHFLPLEGPDILRISPSRGSDILRLPPSDPDIGRVLFKLLSGSECCGMFFCRTRCRGSI
ncbi:hypothetical protein L9F63_020701, partial [Diploptera punctata]